MPLAPFNPYRPKRTTNKHDFDHLTVFEMLSQEINDKFKNDDEEQFGEFSSRVNAIWYRTRTILRNFSPL